MTVNVIGDLGVTSSRAEVAWPAAAQLVQRSSSSARVASKPALAQVESATIG